MHTLTGEEGILKGDVLVHSDHVVEGDITIEDGLAEVGDRVAAHRDEETGESEHLNVGGTSRYRHTVTDDPSKTGSLRFDGVI